MPQIAWASSNDDARLHAALDGLPKGGDPAPKLATLRVFDPARLSLPARLDLLTVRGGLAGRTYGSTTVWLLHTWVTARILWNYLV